MTNYEEREPRQNEGFDEEQEMTKQQEETESSADNGQKEDIVSDEPNQEQPIDLEAKYNHLNDSYLRLMAEYDNYRKRTIREKADLIKNGAESTLINLLPIIDDMERALKTIKSTSENDTLVEGVELIYHKLIAFLSKEGVKPIEALGLPFDTELFEAIATIPVPEQERKGTVLDCVLTGYKLHDKVIRHAKVVVGE